MDYKKFIYVTTLTTPFLFFSILSILGLQYKGVENGLTYWIFSAFISCIAYFVIFITVIKKRFVSFTDIILYLVPIFFLLNYFNTGNFSGLAFQSSIIFTIFVLPACYIGIELGRKKALNNYAFSFLLVGLIVSIGILFTIPALLNSDLNELSEIFAGGHYQALSYFSSLSFLITSIYFFFYLNRHNSIMIIFFVALFFGQIVTILLSGGRGGLVVIFTGLLSILYLKTNKKSFFPYLIASSIFLYISATLLFNFSIGQNDRLLEGAMRTVSYIDSGGINFNASSNRDIYYAQAIEYIKDSPLIGYGIFTMYDNSPPPYFGLPGMYYPHNLFLEILIHGGFLYLFFWILTLSYFFIKLNRILTTDISQVILLAPFIYSFVLLMFSGTYLQEAFFWFSLFYVFAYPLNSNRSDSLKNE
tara:strand:+ start:53 stop:1303 length:1251 start_codon:yes stop_codon:yes gene_type:complete